MPGADRDGLTAGPADRLQAVGGAIVALDSGLGHMSERAPGAPGCRERGGKRTSCTRPTIEGQDGVPGARAASTKNAVR